jgi:hypothetical protein
MKNKQLKTNKMKKLFLLFAVVAIGLASCKKEEHSIRYEVITDYPVDSLRIETVAGKNHISTIDSSDEIVNSTYWTRTISNADISTGTHYEIKVLYHGQQNPGNVRVRMYHNNNIIDETSSLTVFLNGIEYYVEPSCYYMF